MNPQNTNSQKNQILRKSLTALAIFTALLLMLPLQGCNEKKAATNAVPPPEVSVYTVKIEEVSLATELPGRVNPMLVAEVRPQIGGIIQKRLFEEGSDVKEGDVLYQIDPALYKAAYDKAKADLERAEAQIISLKNKFERYEKLIKSSAVSQQEYDDANSAYKTAEADIHACKAAAETARINLEYTQIKAPISGRIGKSNITVGALVTANHLTALAVIQQLDPIYVDVSQSSTSLLRIRQEIEKGLLKNDKENHSKAKAILEDETLYPLEGIQKFRDVTVDQTTGSFILRIVFPNPEKVLLPGMFVRAIIGTGINSQAILVPQQAVSRDAKGRPVSLAVDNEGKVSQKILTIAQAVGNRWLVSNGLAAGDRVIVEGLQKARPGMTVKAVPFEEKAAQAAAPASPEKAK